MFDPSQFGANDDEAGVEGADDRHGLPWKCLVDDQMVIPLPQRSVSSAETVLMGEPGTTIDSNNGIPIGKLIVPSPTPPLMTMAHESDEDSVCADIDRWACSSLEEDGSAVSHQIGGGSARLQDLEEQQQRLSESVLQLSTQFAQIQFRIQQIAQAPLEQRDEMIRQLQEFASRSCIDLSTLKSEVLGGASIDLTKATGADHRETKAVQMRKLITELRDQLAELEQFAWQNGQLGPGELPLSELRERQRLVLERLREKMRLKVELLNGCEEAPDTEQFRQRLEEGLEQALNPLREKDQLVAQLRTQIFDLERYVQFLQQEVAAGCAIDGDAQQPSSPHPGSPSKHPLTSVNDGNDVPLEFRRPISQNAAGPPTHQSEAGWLARWVGCGSAKAAQRNAQRHFERNELKNTPMGNHYGDQRAEMELAVDELAGVLRKNQILAVDRSERAELSVDELNKCILDGGQESIVSSVRKRFCPALKALLEHGLRATVAPTPRRSALLGVIGCLPDRSRQVNSRHLSPDLAKFDGRKLEHIWDVVTLFLEASRALEMRDAVVGQLSDAFKLDSISGKTATSKQILLCTVEHINSSHGKLRRSADTMWKAFVCAALNRNRLPAWIRIIFRSELILTKCYNSWSYVARTGVEDIRPLLESLHEFNFDLPVDLAVRPFEHIKDAFG